MSLRTEPQILQKTIKHPRIDYFINLNEDLSYFDGHFPEIAVLPGVVQIHWAIKLAAEFAVSGKFKAIERLKFTKAMTSNIKVHLKLEQENQHVSFEYYDEKYKYSSGVLVFGE